MKHCLRLVCSQCSDTWQSRWIDSIQNPFPPKALNSVWTNRSKKLRFLCSFSPTYHVPCPSHSTHGDGQGWDRESSKTNLTFTTKWMHLGEKVVFFFNFFFLLTWRFSLRLHGQRNILQMFVFLFFNWSRVDLQCCVSFRCTAKLISYFICIYIYSLLSFFSISFSHIGHYRVLSGSLCYTTVSC